MKKLMVATLIAAVLLISGFSIAKTKKTEPKPPPKICQAICQDQPGKKYKPCINLCIYCINECKDSTGDKLEGCLNTCMSQ